MTARTTTSANTFSSYSVKIGFPAIAAKHGSAQSQDAEIRKKLARRTRSRMNYKIFELENKEAEITGEDLEHPDFDVEAESFANAAEEAFEHIDECNENKAMEERYCILV